MKKAIHKVVTATFLIGSLATPVYAGGDGWDGGSGLCSWLPANMKYLCKKH